MKIKLDNKNSKGICDRQECRNRVYKRYCNHAGAYGLCKKHAKEIDRKIK